MIAADILIVGGGQAGRRAAEGARAAAPDAAITIAGDEPHLPYDRPPLSKEVLLDKAAPATCFKRNAAWFAENRIALALGRRVESVDVARGVARHADGAEIRFRKLVLATGSRARTLPAPDDARITTLRTLEDAQRVRMSLRPGARICVIGAGFIGLEAASAALAHEASVTVIEAADRVLGRVLPAAVGARIEALHRDAGVDVRLGTRVRSIRSTADAVVVETHQGEVAADLVIVGVGIVPNVELARGAGIEVDDGIVVDECGATSHASVYAAGEVVRRPTALGLRRIESWQTAELQAEAAGRSAAGQRTAFTTAPYFWSDQLGVNMQMFGLFEPDAEILARPGEKALYFGLDKTRRIQGVAGFDAGSEMSAAKRLLGAVAPAGLADPKQSLREILRSQTIG